MSETSSRQPSPHDSDYDGAWKDALRGHLGELLEKYFPAAAETIDWQHPPQWSDKELSQMGELCGSCSESSIG
jgi:hypothetical protein